MKQEILPSGSSHIRIEKVNFCKVAREILVRRKAIERGSVDADSQIANIASQCAEIEF